MALATLGALVEALAGRPGLENTPAIVIGREEHLDAQLLEGHIQGRAERGDGREEAQRRVPLAEMHREDGAAIDSASGAGNIIAYDNSGIVDQTPVANDTVQFNTGDFDVSLS